MKAKLLKNLKRKGLHLCYEDPNVEELEAKRSSSGL